MSANPLAATFFGFLKKPLKHLFVSAIKFITGKPEVDPKFSVYQIELFGTIRFILFIVAF